MNADEMVARLRALAKPERLDGMAHYGIAVNTALGLPMPEVRSLAKGVKDHALALDLWETGIHEARILAALVDDPKQVTREQMDHWAAGFDSWDVCDQVCMNLFDRTPFAGEKTEAWSCRDEEFVKRAAFALIASLAVHAKRLPDEVFLGYLPIIEREAADGRNFVRKAVNWALRQIGKRSPSLRQAALETAARIQVQDSPSARWVAADAIRELTSR